jgi:glycerol-3-phosphate dehydrogenase (NAD(P)+)
MAPLSSPNPNPAKSYDSIAVVGAGAWGTALAIVAAGNASKVLLWARESEIVEQLASDRENTLFLPGVRVPENIQATTDMALVRDAEAVLLVAPAQHVRSTLGRLRGIVPPKIPVVLCAKGIETGSGLLLDEILAEVLPDAEPAILSGPSFARDVARKLPTAVTIAAQESVAVRLQESLSQNWFRPYVSEDVVGVALGGAAKNVYAIACGMVEGAGLGESARAATISRGFAELLRLGAALGARSETLMGLSGFGDLVLTATSISSRNFSLGVALGKGAALAEITGAGHPLAEGAATAPALVARARRHGVELPIAEGVAAVLAGKLAVQEAAERLLSRPLKPEVR